MLTKFFFVLVISVPVGYQKVEGEDGEEEEGEGENGGEGEKGQELRVMNGSAGGRGEKTATKKKGSKPPQSRTVTKVKLKKILSSYPFTPPPPSSSLRDCWMPLLFKASSSV